jgi:glucose/arabinose dehydrogenase
LSLSGIFSHLVALIGAAMILLRRLDGGSHEADLGSAPAIPAAKPQAIPTLKMPTARGWTQGQTPVAAPGLKVNAFASGLKHPRWMHLLPNGDVSRRGADHSRPHQDRLDYAIFSTMNARRSLVSPNRITPLARRRW